MRLLLLLFFVSSLFSDCYEDSYDNYTKCSSFNEMREVYSGIDSYISDTLIVEDVHTHKMRYTELYYKENDGDVIKIVFLNDDPKDSSLAYYDYYQVFVGSCPDDQQENDDGVCVPHFSCNDDEFLDSNNTCVARSFPPNFPSNDNNGSAYFADVAMDQARCNPDYAYTGDLGTAVPIGWDSANDKCVVASYRCNNGMTYNPDTQSCSFPADRVVDPDTTTCPLNQFAKYSEIDLCYATSSYVNPPEGYSSDDFLSGHKYILYRCIEDYRIKKVIEVSCGVPNKSDYNDINMTIKPIEQDINASNLPPVDPTDASLTNVAALDGIRESVESLKPILQKSADSLNSIDTKLDTTNQQLSAANQQLGSIDSKLGSSNEYLNSIDSKLNTTNDQLNGIASSLNVDSGSVASVSDTASMFDTDSLGLGNLDDESSFLDDLEDNMAYLTDNITSIKEQFDNTKNLLSEGIKPVELPSGSCNENLNKFGSYLAPYSSAIALYIYVMMMISIFRMIFKYFSRGE